MAKPYTPTPAEKAAIESQVAPLLEELREEIRLNADKWPEYFNRWTDVSTKWHKNFFYIMQQYETPKDSAPDTFEVGLARLRCMSQDRFAIAYWQPSGQWFELAEGFGLEECLRSIREDPWFQRG